MLRWITFLLLAVIILPSCNRWFGNSDREYKDRRFSLDVQQMKLVQRNKGGYPATRLLLNLKDRVTGKYKNYLLDRSYEKFPEEINLQTENISRDSILSNYCILIVYTEDHHTWYTLELSPKDWKANQTYFFTRNER